MSLSFSAAAHWKKLTSLRLLGCQCAAARWRPGLSESRVTHFKFLFSAGPHNPNQNLKLHHEDLVHPDSEGFPEAVTSQRPSLTAVRRGDDSESPAAVCHPQHDTAIVTAAAPWAAGIAGRVTILNLITALRP